MRNIILSLGFASIAALVLAGCYETEARTDNLQAKQTEKLTAEAQRQVGMPNITNFQERKLMKQILELRDKENLVCYAYLTSLEGKLVYFGKCIGFGLPYSVQYTNPQRIDTNYYGATGARQLCSNVISQPDPNGLFMPDGLSATWLMMIDPETGEPRPVYVGPQIVVSPFPLHNMQAEQR